MRFDLEALNSGTWFTMDGGGQICLRMCAGDDYRAIRDQAVKVKTEIVFDPTTRVAQKIREEITDDKKLSDLLWDFCIVDWKDILDSHDQQIPCTREMKILLMGKSPKFSRFVTDGLEKLRAVEASEVEASEKN